MNSFHVVNFSEIGSTNERVKAALAAGHTEGYTVRAQKQTGGYGRQGRLWTSPEGGLYQSVLLRPKRNLAEYPTLGFVMALAIRSTLLHMAEQPESAMKVKWPNDIMVDDDKIAGISMEASAGGVCLGVGVNMFHPAKTADLLSDGKYRPAFFEDLAITYTDGGSISFGSSFFYANQQEAIAAVGDAILSTFEYCYGIWQEKGFSPFMAEYKSCSYLQGKRVRMALLNGATIVEGTVVGVDENAMLLVDDGTQVMAVNSGEAHVL